MVTWTEFLAAFETTLRHLFFSIRALGQPSGILQMLILIGGFALAHYTALYIEPRFEKWLRSLETSMARLRFAILVLRRLRLIFFVALMWIAVAILRAITWPSWSYLLVVVGNLAAVWVVISISSRLIRNPLAARTVAVAAWIFAALSILDLMPMAVATLDAASITVGNLRLSLLLVIKAVVTLTVLLWLAAVISRATERRVAGIEDLSPSMRVLAGKFVRIGLFTIAFIIGLQSIGFDLTTITVFSGAVGIGLGFGLQKVVSNLVSGVILLLDKSIKPGDVISLGETYGAITSLGARYVSVVTRDGREFLIPNEDLITTQVINWTYSDPKVRLDVPFGVSYDADPDTVRELAVEAAGSVARVQKIPAPVCHLTGFGDSSVDFLLRFWIDDPSGGVVNVKGQVLRALWYALKDHGVELPYPQRDIHIRGPVEISGHGLHLTTGPRQGTQDGSSAPEANPAPRHDAGAQPETPERETAEKDGADKETAELDATEKGTGSAGGKTPPGSKS